MTDPWWDEYYARRAWNLRRWELRQRGLLADPNHDFTGAARIDYEMLCLQGIHPVAMDRQTCDVCGDWVVGRPPEGPQTDVLGSSTRSRGRRRAR